MKLTKILETTQFPKIIDIRKCVNLFNYMDFNHYLNLKLDYISFKKYVKA